MKPNLILYRTIVGLVVAFVSSCASVGSPNFTPLKNGFGYALRSKGLVHVRAWGELQYVDASGRRTMVWPYVLEGLEDVTITNTTAILIGKKAMRDDVPDKHEVLVNRVIAIDAPHTVMDISEDVLKILCMENNLSFSAALKNYEVGSLKSTKTGFDVGFVVLKEKQPTGITCSVTWSQVFEIMVAVKKEGKVRTEIWSGHKYFQREFLR